MNEVTKVDVTLETNVPTLYQVDQEIANEAAPSSRFPPAHLARSRSQNALRTAVPAAVGITEYKGVQNEEILKDELPVLGAPDTMEKTASRSRCLVKQLERGEASVVELKRNLDYAASVLEALCIEEASMWTCGPLMCLH
uniref:calcium/calmodulin-dependent 3',5'-cyclic nucleotide phosphodiesterase 1C-like n=1 Tax=Gasterosteus aculeatus aculeatus TaxID=481459 RepID=UPI001A9A11D2|nr:calcium/calmodulin-dependent 3',5'-cyclic nucleotide phosphodiesterase 1C-like [Gasterosteus aculeatus aculeatus]